MLSKDRLVQCRVDRNAAVGLRMFHDDCTPAWLAHPLSMVVEIRTADVVADKGIDSCPNWFMIWRRILGESPDGVQGWPVLEPRLGIVRHSRPSRHQRLNMPCNGAQAVSSRCGSPCSGHHG